MFLQKINHLCSENGIKLTNRNKDAFEIIYNLAKKWGSSINITANLEEEKFIYENILDPILALKCYKDHINRVPFSIIDIGCGGGFVGLIWHIFKENEFKTILFDSDRKKINFCRQLIRELDLKNVEAIQGRAEIASIGHFDTIVTRATFKLLEDGIQKCQRFCDRSGKIVLFRGNNDNSVLEQFKGQEIVYDIKPKVLKRRLFVVSPISQF